MMVEVVAYDIRKATLPTSLKQMLVPLKSTANKSNTPTSKWIICVMEPGQGLFEEE